jgi:hypothetical protein
MLESLPFEHFHDDEGVGVDFVHFVNGADVGMVQRGGGARFALESFQRLRISSEFIGQEFQRDKAAELQILGSVDHTHAATAEPFDDAVMRNCAADEWLGFRHRRAHIRMRVLPSQRVRRGARVHGSWLRQLGFSGC